MGCASRPLWVRVRDAIDLLIVERRKDKAFRERVRKMIQEDRAILDRLAK